MTHVKVSRTKGYVAKAYRYNAEPRRGDGYERVMHLRENSHVFMVFLLRPRRQVDTILIMPNTFTQLHIQVVIAVKYREGLIAPSWKERMHKYITQTIQDEGHKMLRINSMPDHLHLFFGYNINQTIPDLIRKVKSGSSKWINENKFTRGTFRWQEGYAAFSYARSQVKTVAAYIDNQEEHHKTITFGQEYVKMLDTFEIKYDPKYLFHPPI